MHAKLTVHMQMAVSVIVVMDVENSKIVCECFFKEIIKTPL